MAEKRGPTRSLRPLLLAGVGVLVFLVAVRYFHVPLLLRRSLDWVAGLGPTGVIAFVAIYVLACVFMLPGSVLTLGAGAVFGVVKGTAICLGGLDAGRHGRLSRGPLPGAGPRGADDRGQRALPGDRRGRGPRGVEDRRVDAGSRPSSPSTC